MEFKRLHGTSACNCIDNDCQVNTEDHFYRRLFAEIPTDKDFESFEEMGKGKLDSNHNCKKVCSYKALSITKEAEGFNINEFYAASIAIKPNIAAETPFYCKLKFTSTCGKTKPSPSSRDSNHYSFFKSDGFDFNKIVLTVNSIKS